MRTKEQIEDDYAEATRNLSPERREAIERDPREAADDSPHIAKVKDLYRELTPDIAGNGDRERNGFQGHA